MRDLYPDDLGLRQFSQRFVSASFDPTCVRLVLSSQQMKPKPAIHPSIESQPPFSNSPPAKLAETATTSSPKRPFPSDDVDDGQPRKVLRGESPLKGAAGRRMDQQRRHNANGLVPSSLSQMHPAPPPPLPGQINFLLSIIPKASTYVDARFDPVKMVELLRDVRIPPSPSMRPPEQPAPTGWPPAAPLHPPPSTIHPGFGGGGPGTGQPQFGGKFLRC